MSTTTSNFGLFKYDTTADAQTAFSITNALNNNWDKLDSNCVRRLSTSAATGSGVRPVYVDASGQVQTINYDLPTTAPLTATTSLSENGYIKFSSLVSRFVTFVYNSKFSIPSIYQSIYRFIYLQMGSNESQPFFNGVQNLGEIFGLNKFCLSRVY